MDRLSSAPLHALSEKTGCAAKLGAGHILHTNRLPGCAPSFAATMNGSAAAFDPRHARPGGCRSAPMSRTRRASFYAVISSRQAQLTLGVTVVLAGTAPPALREHRRDTASARRHPVDRRPLAQPRPGAFGREGADTRVPRRQAIALRVGNDDHYREEPRSSRTRCSVVRRVARRSSSWPCSAWTDRLVWRWPAARARPVAP